uniref:Myb-like domain-containing protein n=1 Tax=Brassica oleracea var. oleracea TaxID=109376 RepID=A0A0D2ZS84_BRAOL
MGGTDAKDILGLPKTPLSLAQEKRSRPQKESHRKPDGISREVAWQWLPVKSSARSDDLQLFHWVRVVNDVPPSGDYSIQQSVDVLKYTDDEYENHLTDPVWTKEETDQLFELCERFDLRFTVIADRFPLSRTLEELKDRYYSGFEPYDRTRDRERKRALSMVLSQSRHQEKKDAEILAEAHRDAFGCACKCFLKINRAAEPDVPANENIGSVSPSSNSQLPATAVAPSTLSMADYASTLASLHMLHVYLRTYGLEQMVQAASSAVGLRTIKRVDYSIKNQKVHHTVKGHMPQCRILQRIASEPFSFGAERPIKKEQKRKVIQISV